MRHGELHGSMTAFMLLDQLAPCECGHPQQDHDEDDRCTRCECDLFRDGEGEK